MEMLRTQREEMTRIKQREGSPKHPVRLSEEEALVNQEVTDSSEIVNANGGKEMQKMSRW